MELVKIIEKPTSPSKRIVKEVVEKELAKENDGEKPIEEVDSPSDIDNYYRVDFVKKSIEDNLLKKAHLIYCDAPIVHLVGEETKKVLGNAKVVEAPPYSSKSNPPIGIIEPSLFSPSHHKPYKKDTRKWRIKKKKHGDHHFESGPISMHENSKSAIVLEPQELKLVIQDHFEVPKIESENPSARNWHFSTNFSYEPRQWHAGDTFWHYEATQ
ncbi:hypothetical protein PanWU01x14_341270 [Parasponia andersonii]|uniref:Uncharacterized protein n=1 Tax=Parasponia andersonii TaxID=3476 RepID=A0A2P5AE68_PARAD|nr:hypothetical protein PanWU01x14_341270 [Parasponia andersonii]